MSGQAQIDYNALAAQNGAVTSTPPPAAPAQQPAPAPAASVDYNAIAAQNGAVNSAPPPPPAQPSLWQRVKNMAAGFDAAETSVPLPATAGEHVAAIAGGPDAVDAVRKAQAVTDAHKKLMTAKPGDYAQAQQDFTDAVTAANGNPTISATPKTSGADVAAHVANLSVDPVGEITSDLDDLTSKISSYTQEGRADHPILAAVGDAVNSAKELLTGGQSAGKPMGTKSGVLNNPVTQAMATAPGAAEAGAAIEENAPKVIEHVLTQPEGEGDAEMQAAKTANTPAKTPATSETPIQTPIQKGKTLYQQVTQGEKVAQVPAQTALREGAQASAEDAGIAAAGTEAPAQGAGIRTLMAKPITAVSKVEDGLYSTLNDAAETDMKDLYDKQERLRDALDDPTNVAQHNNLQEALDETEAQIRAGEMNVQAKLGTDAQTLLKQAKATTQQRYAMETLDQKIFNNESVVSGDVAHDSPETINVDNAIRQAQNLDKPSKFAPRGTPTRLQQALGEDGAKAFKQGLYDAKKAGETAVSRQALFARIGKIAGWTTSIGGGIAGVGTAIYEAMK